MKLLGRDLPQDLWNRIEEKLAVRGLIDTAAAESATHSHVEARVDPHRFNLSSMEENADTTRGLPLHTHRGGAGRAVLLAKWAFRKSCQVLINETLGRQRVFNGLVLDSYAQLSAEVVRLRRELETIRERAEAAPAPATATTAAVTKRAPREASSPTPASRAAPKVPSSRKAKTTDVSRPSAPKAKAEASSPSSKKAGAAKTSTSRGATNTGRKLAVAKSPAKPGKPRKGN